MKDRCKNPHNSRYHQYKFFWNPAWDQFVNFLRDMGDRPEGHTLDRIDGSLPYSKENCKWSTDQEQRRNKLSAGYCLDRCHHSWMIRIHYNKKNYFVVYCKNEDIAKIGGKEAHDYSKQLGLTHDQLTAKKLELRAKYKQLDKEMTNALNTQLCAGDLTSLPGKSTAVG